MPAMDDMELLRDYATRDSEEAFTTLVTRHIDLVYAAALRHTRNHHQAQEVTQSGDRCGVAGQHRPVPPADGMDPNRQRPPPRGGAGRRGVPDPGPGGDAQGAGRAGPGPAPGAAGAA